MSTETAASQQSQFQGLFNQFDDQLIRLNESAKTISEKTQLLGCNPPLEKKDENIRDEENTITGELKSKIHRLEILNNEFSDIKGYLIDLVG